MEPQNLGRYRLIRRLATGGMGEVYLGQADGAANFSKQVAIKRILPHLRDQSDFVRKFIDEANVMVQMHHGNIVSVVELADEDGQLYLVMDYVPGRDLKAVIRALKTEEIELPVDLALWVIRQILDGLDYAHRKVDEHGIAMNIVHRDVSPANIVLGTGGEVKLIDFGIARARGRIQQSVSGTLQGKFVYMSPEQAAGQTVTPSTDIFSAGLVLYELLCLVRPFDGSSETEILRLVRECQIKPPSVINKSGSDALDTLVMKALQPNAADRYVSCADMGQEIRRHLVEIKSEAGAADLAMFLERLFPEGVVPKEEPSPRSLDDALMHQLDVFTPSPNSRLGVTRTQTENPSSDSESLRARHHANNPLAVSPTASAFIPGSTPPPYTPSEVGITPITYPPGPTFPPMEVKPAGRKRMLLLGLILGALGALGALFVGSNQQGQVVVQTEPSSVKEATVTVDGVPLRPGEDFTSERVYSFCAVAKGFLKQCDRHRVKPGENKILFTLVAQPKLIPNIRPSGVAHRILIDRVHTTEWPFFMKPNREHVVCVEARGYVATPNCVRVTAETDDLYPVFDLTAEAKVTPPLANELGRGGQGDGQSQASTGSPSNAKATQGSGSGPSPRRRSRGLTNRQKKAAVVTIRSIPTATVSLHGKDVGTTPYPANVHKVTQRFTLRAKGYADTPFDVTSNARTHVETIALERPGYLTIRISPAASEIYIDKKHVATGVLIRHPLRSGGHQLEVLYKKGGRVAAQYGPRTIMIVAGEDANLPPVSLNLPPK